MERSELEPTTLAEETGAVPTKGNQAVVGAPGSAKIGEVTLMRPIHGNL